MAHVFLPPSLHALTGKVTQIDVAGATVGEVIDSLEQRFPGVKARLVTDDLLRLGLVAGIDAKVKGRSLAQSVNPESELHFLTSLSGG